VNFNSQGVSTVSSAAYYTNESVTAPMDVACNVYIPCNPCVQ
jgi:hypothetical protein